MPKVKKPRSERGKLHGIPSYEEQAAKLDKVWEELAARQAQARQHQQQLQTLKPKMQQWDRFTRLVEHDLEVGPDPNMFIDLIQEMFLDNEDDPELRKTVDQYIEGLRRKAQSFKK
jgi:hypothetical protein